MQIRPTNQMLFMRSTPAHPRRRAHSTEEVKKVHNLKYPSPTKATPSPTTFLARTRMQINRVLLFQSLPSRATQQYNRSTNKQNKTRKSQNKQPTEIPHQPPLQKKNKKKHHGTQVLFTRIVGDFLFVASHYFFC